MKSPTTSRPTKAKAKAAAKNPTETAEAFGEEQLVDSLWDLMMAQEKANPSVSMLHDRIEGDLRLIGLTGGIASGKSTVASLLKEQRIPVIDADQIARDVVEPGMVGYREIVKAFGEEILDEHRAIHRAKLGALVFGDPAKRKRLEEITHPLILRTIAEEVRRLHREIHPKVIVIDAALLFESGLNLSMDRTILVKASRETQLRRLLERGGLSRDEAAQRIDSQMDTEAKEKLSDFVIDNEGSLEALRQETLGVLTQIG